MGKWPSDRVVSFLKVKATISARNGVGFLADLKLLKWHAFLPLPPEDLNGSPLLIFTIDRILS